MKKDIFKEAAIHFLKFELERQGGDLEFICQEGRMMGGTDFPGGVETVVSLGNILTTSKKHPAKFITVEYKKEKRKFNVQDIYKIIKNEIL